MRFQGVPPWQPEPNVKVRLESKDEESRAKKVKTLLCLPDGKGYQFYGVRGDDHLVTNK